MKAPDKIYAAFMNGQPIGISVHKLISLPHAYIRKDALLEWAKKEMGEWSSESTTAQGVKMGLTLVIDKIESL